MAAIRRPVHSSSLRQLVLWVLQTTAALAVAVVLPLPTTAATSLMSSEAEPHFSEARSRWPLLLTIATGLAAGVAGYLFGNTRSATLSGAESQAPAELAEAADTNSIAALERKNRSGRSASASDWNNRWRAALARRNSPSRDREMAALIKELARTDHTHALELAAAEKNWRVRDLLRDAALHGWASVAPDEAGDYAVSLPPQDRRAAVAAVFRGTADTPDETTRQALRLCQADPGPAGDYGHAAIEALAEAGAFAEAVKFGQQIGAEKFPFLMKSAFFQWARSQPREALAGCDQLEDSALRSAARNEVISGWAWAEPKALAEYGLKVESADDRKGALNAALPLWMEREPEVAINWINSHNSGPEFDAGVAAAANLQSFIVNQPNTAMDLATRVSDPTLRKQTMRTVFRQWALADLPAARSYAANRKEAAERATLEGEIEDLLQ
jgi:hypothetical protein